MQGGQSYRLYTQAIADRLAGKRTTVVFRRDDGLRRKSDVDWLLRGYTSWPWEERQVLRFARGRVLDIGCGAGRHSLYLQRKGFRVTGVDASPIAVDLARRRGVRDVRRMDARRLRFHPRERFDTVLFLGGNLGVAGAATPRVLAHLRRWTSDRARILADSRFPGWWMEPHAAYLRANVRRGRPPGLIRLRAEYRGKVGDWFDLWLFSPDELARIARPLGWEIGRTFVRRLASAEWGVVLEKSSRARPARWAATARINAREHFHRP